MEVLLSRVEPRELLAGKVIGIGLVGLTQLLLGLAAAAVALVAFDTLEVPHAVPVTLAAGVLWFGLGYAFWSVAYAAVGALVSRVEDLQPAVAPLSWVLILSFWVAFLGSDSANAWYTQLASFVPITAPFVMPIRLALGNVAGWEMALAVLITIATTYALVRLSAAVYSGALLRSGGRPRIADAWHAARS
jgi:ABC-2 type transport system permease protein